jgi:hypothetical protein
MQLHTRHRVHLESGGAVNKHYARFVDGFWQAVISALWRVGCTGTAAKLSAWHEAHLYSLWDEAGEMNITTDQLRELFERAIELAPLAWIGPPLDPDRVAERSASIEQARRELGLEIPPVVQGGA